MLDQRAAGMFARTPRVDFPRLLSSAAEGSISPDDWITMTQPLRDQFGSNELGTEAYGREFGALIAAIVGRSGGPEITGQAHAMMQSTIAKLRLRDVIGTITS